MTVYLHKLPSGPIGLRGPASDLVPGRRGSVVGTYLDGRTRILNITVGDIVWTRGETTVARISTQIKKFGKATKS